MRFTAQDGEFQAVGVEIGMSAWAFGPPHASPEVYSLAFHVCVASET